MAEASSSTEAGADQTSQGVAASLHDAVCAIDGTDDSLAAIEHAASLVGADGHLTLLVATAFRHEGQMRSPAISPARATEIIDDARRTADQTGVRASIAVEPDGGPVDVILEYAARHDLLALGAPATSSWLGSLFLDGVSYAAEDSLNTPLLVSRRLSAGKTVGTRLLVASDGLDTSDALVDVTCQFARRQGSGAVLLHVLGSESQAHPHRIEHQAPWLAALGEGRGELRFDVGTPREVIVEVARDIDATLILMSSRRLTGLRTIGSVSRPVVHHAHCPVLLIPPELLSASQV
jgi:nucleotide-binding universal stress UspA family protein